jgi:hypothetical protein
MAAITYISQILNGMMMLAMIFQTLSRGMASAKRLGEVLETASSIVRDDTLPQASGERKGTVSFRNVRFAYAHNGKTVLHDIGILVEPFPSQPVRVVRAILRLCRKNEVGAAIGDVSLAFLKPGINGVRAIATVQPSVASAQRPFAERVGVGINTEPFDAGSKDLDLCATRHIDCKVVGRAVAVWHNADSRRSYIVDRGCTSH